MGGVPFFPNHVLRTLVVAVLVLAIAATAALVFPRAMADPADPSRPPDVLLSTWIVADVSRALVYYTDPWGPTLFVLLGVILALVPLFDRAPDRTPRRRQLRTALGVVFLAGLTVAWVAGWRLRFEPVSATGELTPYQQSPITTEPGAPLPPVVPPGDLPTPPNDGGRE